MYDIILPFSKESSGIFFRDFLQKRCFYLFHFIFDLWPYAFTAYNPYKHNPMAKKRKKIWIYDIFQIKSHSYRFHTLFDKLQEGKVMWHVYMLLDMYVLFSRSATSWLIFFLFFKPYIHFCLETKISHSSYMQYTFAMKSLIKSP